VFQLYLEHLTYFWNISSAIWIAFNVSWNASSVNTIHVPVKRRIGMCLECMLKNFEGPLKIKGRVIKKKLISGGTCPSKGLLIDITSKHL
jgi:hypothetical protein